MGKIKVQKTITPEEFYRSNSRECMTVGGEEVVKLTYPDGKVKYVHNHAVPTETLAGEPFKEQGNDILGA